VFDIDYVTDKAFVHFGNMDFPFLLNVIYRVYLFTLFKTCYLMFMGVPLYDIFTEPHYW